MTPDNVDQHQTLTALIAFTDFEDHVHVVRVTTYVRELSGKYNIYVDVGGKIILKAPFSKDQLDYDFLIKFRNHPDRINFEYEGIHILFNRTHEGLIVDITDSKNVIGTWAMSGDEILEDEEIITNSPISISFTPLNSREELLTFFASIKQAGLLFHADDDPYEVFERDSSTACAMEFVYQKAIVACENLDIDIHDITLTTLNSDNKE